MLASQLHASGVPVFPCTPNKMPAVKGWQNPLPPEQYNWQSGLVGIPIPPGTTIIDLDTYKGVTRESVEQLLGCTLPWDEALIQTTMRGGQHYAFSVDWRVKQGSNLKDANGNDIKGLDTRVAGKGLIATGKGYTHVGFGPFALAHPGTLPKLPDATRHLLEHVQQAPAERAELPQGDKDLAALRDALVHIDPGGSRSDWMRVGMALRHHYHDEPEQGLSLFDDWSSGGLWKDGEPANYDSESMDFQWSSIKPEGGITVASLFYTAMQSGWRPPATFDTSLAFGQGSAPVDQFAAMIDHITAEGGNAKSIDSLLQAIATLPCSPIQRDLLVTSLKYELREAKLLDKKLGDKIDRQLRSDTMPAFARPQLPLPAVLDVDDIPERPLGRPSAVHGSNADQMVGEVFQERLGVIDGVLRWWSGREWQRLSEDKAFRLVAQALKPDHCKAPNIAGTIKLLPTSCPVLPGQSVDRRAYFANGVLDMGTGAMLPHSPENYNTGCMGVAYNPRATCPQWFKFLTSIFFHLEDGADRVNKLQEIMGWALIRDGLNVQKVIALDGASRGGKGLVLEVLQVILGDTKWGAADFTNLDCGKTQSAFRNSDVLIDSEAKPPQHQTAKRAIGFMNKVASNEVVSVPLLHTQTPWEGRLNAKFIFACNGIPIMIDDSGASTNRLEVLRFDKSFSGIEDKTLAPRLISEAEGVAAWAIEGLRRLIANNGNFTQPASSIESLNHMKEENQPLRDFIAEYMTHGQDERCHLTDVWNAYRVYAADCNIRLPGKTQFSRSLRLSLLGSDVKEKRAIRVNGENKQGYEGMSVRSVSGDAFAMKGA
jgi:P4 family phage/plasmid primase-like protien